MTLILVADASNPFDLSLLPPGVRAVAGYVGGDTPHVWSNTEVKTVTDSGRQWWPIWTAPSRGQVLTAPGGTFAAQSMLSRLNSYPYITDDLPMFLDIENGTWNASPSGALAYLNAWKAEMRKGGVTRAFGYVPWSVQFDWVANWQKTAPTSLPPSVIGWQYASDTQLGKPFDLSVFNSAILGGTVSAPGGLTDVQAKQLAHIEQLTALVNAAETNELPAVAEMRGEVQALYATIAVSAARDAALLDAIRQLAAGGSQGVDLLAIQHAAQAGAQAALAGYSLSLTKPAGTQSQ